MDFERLLTPALILDKDRLASTAEPIYSLIVESIHQEHGHVTGPDPLPFDRLPVGSKVLVLPNHVCMTAAAYDAYNVIDGGGDIISTWDRGNGW